MSDEQPTAVFAVAYENDELGTHHYVKVFACRGEAQAWIDDGKAQEWYRAEYPDHAQEMDSEEAAYPDQPCWADYFLVLPIEVHRYQPQVPA